jgi:hypothetical protein
VLDVAERTGGHSFDAPRAEYTHTRASDGSGHCCIERELE